MHTVIETIRKFFSSRGPDVPPRVALNPSCDSDQVLSAHVGWASITLSASHTQSHLIVKYPE